MGSSFSDGAVPVVTAAVSAGQDYRHPLLLLLLLFLLLPLLSLPSILHLLSTPSLAAPEEVAAETAEESRQQRCPHSSRKGHQTGLRQ